MLRRAMQAVLGEAGSQPLALASFAAQLDVRRCWMPEAARLGETPEAAAQKLSGWEWEGDAGRAEERPGQMGIEG